MAGDDASVTDVQIDELLSLEHVRAQAQKVLQVARARSLTHFEYDESRMPEVADFVMGVIERGFGPDKYDQIPLHGRWQQFNTGNTDRIAPLLRQWVVRHVDLVEQTRRMVDLLFVSVLLDAGAGDVWEFTEFETGQTVGRSEGIALASFHMFLAGKFQARSDNDYSVNGNGLLQLDMETMQEGFQITSQNSMTAFSSRVELLNRFGSSLLKLTDIFGVDGRPGNLVDILLSNSPQDKVVDFALLWNILQQVLLPVWPENRPRIAGRPIGDAWPLQVLAQRAEADGKTTPTSNVQPFHKLTQWIAYSLKAAFKNILGFHWINDQVLTGLPEYRNGGIFIDIPVLRLNADALKRGQQHSGHILPQFDATSDEIVEWRAVTVALVDELHKILEARYKEKKAFLSLGQMLEAGTFKAGRELAAKYRPTTKSSPILIAGDGTLF